MTVLSVPAHFPNKAMVLAAGLGTRMRAYCPDLPKPLVPVAGKPLIDWTLDVIAEAGVEHAVVNLSYMAEQLEVHLQARSGKKPSLQFSPEDQPLETGGGIKKALPMLGAEPFFSLNSDVIVLNGAEPFLHRLARAWNPEVMDALLLMTPTATASGYRGRGDFHVSPTGVLTRRGEDETAAHVFAGVQLLHPRMFDGAPEGPFSMNVLYNRGIDDHRRLQRVFGLIHDGAWLHVGDGEGVAEAEQRLKARAANR